MHKWTAKSNTRGSLCIRMASIVGRGTCLLTVLIASGNHVIGAPCTPRAIVIGVSIYKDPSLTLLSNARKDAIAFRDWFQKNTVCGSASAPGGKPVVKLLTDDEASRINILNALSG